MRPSSFVASSLLFAAIIALPAGAAPIVDQLFDSTQPGALSNQGPADQQVADDFSIASLIALGPLTWFGRYDGAIGTVDPTDFTIRIFSDQGGMPVEAPFFEINVSVSPTVTGLDFGGSPWFSYSADLGSPVLGTGVYWLSILESDASTPLAGDSLWLWGETGTVAQRSVRSADATPWTLGSGNNVAFTINSSVPEPSTWLLLGTGVLALGAARKRRAKK